VKAYKNAKITHDDTGKPWDKGPKAKKPKTLKQKDNFHDNFYAFDHDHLYEKKYKSYFSSYDVEAVELYTATKVSADEKAWRSQFDIQTIEGTEVKVEKKLIPKDPKSGFMFHVTGFNVHLSMTWGDDKHWLASRVEEFLQTPFPEPEPSLLILPKEFEEQRRREKQRDALVEFVQKEVDSSTKPLKSTVEIYRREHLNAENKVYELTKIRGHLEVQLAMAKAEIDELRKYHTRVAVATVATGVRTRHFRAED